ncbi:helix-turn-helix domain-containing protein [Clostridium gasigenes]|uniref:Helix-turn-helix domain-containing protein n=1 Tax=Clostridium gasigenes TaxID=94869 RepID=A0A1H0T682_9CLOT|nr:helix-turn-helix domain-containing protein [Clostridium gasigenes]MBB6715737.1 helix-turn-helix domain-containing protein [Clostridium gasigenes]MBU3088881.1 XRE family transcriptional regulator [Clostridium gasigenes]MBU3105697.1 XRE family transcriptional regulator [Clostridium gasigenes]MBU3137547.1 XRE family transcriptional regulator [Clostridium gasigenes]SDP49260.1 Helix-turn-helix domain-containing protein [Clostridium gasigenes]
MSRVGEKIKEARLKIGMTQKALGKKLGVADKYINDVELGRKVALESFIDKAAKILKTDLNDISMVVTDEAVIEERAAFNETKNSNSKKKIETNEVWNEAFASVLKNVPIYDYTLKKDKGFKELPIHSNKVEGYPLDKVFYLEVQDDEMTGFRMLKGDLVFSHLVKEVTNNGIFLVDYKDQIKIRQIKNLGNSKILLVSNGGGLMTETMEAREIQVIAKLERIEIKI